jgi:hypothetical protein
LGSGSRVSATHLDSPNFGHPSILEISLVSKGSGRRVISSIAINQGGCLSAAITSSEHAATKAYGINLFLNRRKPVIGNPFIDR